LTFPTRAVVIGAAVALLAVVGAGVRHSQEKLAVARDEAQKAVAAAVLAQKQADASTRVAAAYQLAADSAVAAEHRAELHADSAARAVVRLRSSFAEKAKTAPDTCRPVIAAADSTIAALDSTVQGLTSALRSSQEARSDLQTALDTTRAALARTKASDADLIRATSVLIKASHTPFYLRLLPHPGISSTAGVDIHGKPNIVTGLSLGWSISF